MPANAIPEQLAALGKTCVVGLYCQRGQRSLVLARQLRAQGVEQVVSLRGGLDAWPG